MVANPTPPPASEPVVAPLDAVSYIFLTMKELERLASASGDVALIASVREARSEAAAALERLSQAGGR